MNTEIEIIVDILDEPPYEAEFFAVKGLKGDKGDRGDKGDTGEQGPQGIQGIQGEKGETGDRGPQGIQGIQGEKGDKGDTGERGPQGIQGPRGEIGPQGPQGVQGIQGIPGEKGETGDQGPKGEKGDKGDPGEGVAISDRLGPGTGELSLVAGDISRNRAIGNNSIADGSGTIARGYQSRAEGLNSVSDGARSHAEGNSTIASGAQSHAEGNGTVASGMSTHVAGEYNVDLNQSVTGTPYLRGTYAEIIGNGTSQNNRSNARTLDWNGNEWVAGKMTVGVGPSGNMDVANKKYVDDSVEVVNDRLNRIGIVYVIKGTVASISGLPANATVGDVYTVTDLDKSYAWNGSSWEECCWWDF